MPRVRMLFEHPFPSSLLRRTDAAASLSAWILKMPAGKIPCINKYSQSGARLTQLLKEHADVGELWYTELAREYGSEKALQSRVMAQVLQKDQDYFHDCALDLIKMLFDIPLNTEAVTQSNVRIATYRSGAIYLCTGWTLQNTPVVTLRTIAPPPVLEVFELHMRDLAKDATGYAEYCARNIGPYIVAAYGARAFKLWGTTPLFAPILARSPALDDDWALAQRDNANILSALAARQDILSRPCGARIMERWFETICATRSVDDPPGRWQVTLTKEESHGL